MAADSNSLFAKMDSKETFHLEEILPPEWEIRSMDDGRIYYVNHLTKSTQWQHPKTGKKFKVSGELPYGWRKQYDSKGNVFFFDLINKCTSYVDPRLAASLTKNKSNSKVLDGNSTSMHVLSGEDLSGRFVVVTGANSGIGFETARALALHGAQVVLACRDVSKANAAAARIRAEQTPEANVDTMFLDLASFRSIRMFAKEYRRRKLPLHVLICNAAVFFPTYNTTEDGIESTFGINHLGHFYLVQLLEDILCSSSPARVVVLSSESHRFPELTYSKKLQIADVPLSRKNYWSILAYNQSKLCNLLFSMELNRRWRSKGVASNAVHPGNLIYTSLNRHSCLLWILFLLARPFAKSVPQGAATVVYCATAKELRGVGGHYFNNCGVCDPSKEAKNPDTAAQLWKLSEQLIREISIAHSSV